MSLNGLDAPALQEAYQQVSHEATGWFLLQYTNRDSVDLLARGKGGVHEARAAIAKYTDTSPLYGLIFYRRRKFLIKYVPEGTSRLLQVHVHDILERYSPYETLLEIATADELNDTSLAASFPLHTAASPSVSSNRLHEISEDAEDGPTPRRLSQSDAMAGASFGTPRYKMDKRVDQIIGGLPASRPSARLSTLSAARAAPVSPVSPLKPSPAHYTAPDDSALHPVASISSSTKSLSSEHGTSDPSFRQSESSDRTSTDLPQRMIDTLASSELTQQVRSSDDSTEKQDVARQPSLSELPRLSVSTERTSTEISNSERRKLDDDPYDLSKYDFIPKVKLGPRPVTSEDRTKRPKVASISSIPATYRPSGGRKSEGHRSQSHVQSIVNTTPIMTSLPTVTPVPLPPIPIAPEYTPRPVSRGSIKSMQSQKTVMTSEKLRLMKAVELRKRQLRRSTPRLSEVTMREDAADVPEVPLPGPSPPSVSTPIVDSSILEEEEEQHSAQKKPDSGIAMLNESSSSTNPQGVTAPSLELAQTTPELPSSPSGEVESANESFKANEPNTGSVTSVESGVLPEVEHSASAITPLSPDADVQKTFLFESDQASETFPLSASEEHVHDSAESPLEITEPMATEEPVSADMEQEATKAIQKSPIDDHFTLPGEAAEDLPADQEEDVPQLADQPMLDALHRGIREGLGISEMDEANLEVPKIVMADGTRPISALLPKATVAADRASLNSQASSLEDVHMSIRRQNSDLARRRRGLVAPLQVEDDSLASDDEFFEELQSATFGEAKPVTVPKSPIGQNFTRRPSGSSLHSLGSVRSVTISPKLPSPPESRSSHAVTDRETSPGMGQASDAGENLAGRRNVSAGISRRIQTLTEASSREAPVFLTAQSTTPRPLTPDAYPDEFRPKDRNRLTKAPKGRSKNEPPRQQAPRSSVAWNAPPQSHQAPIVADRVVRTASARESVTVTARIVRSNTASGADNANAKMQQPDVIMNYKRTSMQQDDLPVLDTSLSIPKSDHGDGSVSQSAPSSRASHRKSWARHQRSLSPSAEDFPSPPSHSAMGGAGSRTSFMLWDDEPVAASKEGSRTSRFFKRMSHLGSSSKRKSIAPQSSNYETSVSPVSSTPIVETPPAIVVGDLNIQFPDTLLWKRRIVEVDAKGFLTFAIPLALDIQKNSAKKYHLTDFEVPYAPDLDRQELPNSVLLDSLDGNMTLQVACEDSLSHRQVLNTLRSHWKAWNNVPR